MDNKIKYLKKKELLDIIELLYYGIEWLETLEGVKIGKSRLPLVAEKDKKAYRIKKKIKKITEGKELDGNSGTESQE